MGGSVRPPVVLRFTRSEAGPLAVLGAVMLSERVAGAVGVQLAGVTVRVPDEGVTAIPPGSGTTCQRTVVASSPAEAAPIVIVVGCPAVTVVAPLGSENPTAASWPDPKEGGLASGDEPQVGSGESETV
jgi:hypothetical protein